MEEARGVELALELAEEAEQRLPVGGPCRAFQLTRTETKPAVTAESAPVRNTSSNLRAMLIVILPALLFALSHTVGK